MEGRHFCYPAPHWFDRALGGTYAEAWLKGRGQPQWYRPATLSLVAPRGAQETRGQSGQEAFDRIRAAQLRHEMALFARMHGAPARVAEISWTAGVTGLTERALRAVHAAVTECFDVRAGARFTARVSMASWRPELLSALRAFGVTTLHAICPPTHSPDCASIEQFIAAARTAGFGTIAIDVPIDLPNGSVNTVRGWVAALSACRPSRIFLTRSGKRASDRDGRTWQVWRETYANLIAIGYQYVAQDAFVVHTDEFVKAKHTTTLTPTPFGYSICPSHVSIAIGQGAVGHVGPMHYQNARDPMAYAALLGREALPVERGLLATRDDLVRQKVIAGFLTNFSVDIESIEASYGIAFSEAFPTELMALDRLELEGLVEREGVQLRLTPAGRFGASRVADVFDRYARRPEQVRSSREG
ncbi:MAG: hypothetical protein ACTHKH_10770 [Trinickia sp.]